MKNQKARKWPPIYTARSTKTQPSAPPTQLPTYSPVQDSESRYGVNGGCRRDQAHIQVEVGCETSWILSRGRADTSTSTMASTMTHATSRPALSTVGYIYSRFSTRLATCQAAGFLRGEGRDGDVVARGSDFYSSEEKWFLVSTRPPEELELWMTTSSTPHVFSGEDFDDHILDQDLEELRVEKLCSSLQKALFEWY